MGPMYRIIWKRPAPAGITRILYGTYTEYDDPPIMCWSAIPENSSIYASRTHAEQERRKRCDVLCIAYESPELQIEEHTNEMESGTWVPSP